MFRVIGTFGLGGAFLLISPELRGTVIDGINACARFLDVHSPLSYVGVGVVILLGGMVWIYRAAQPRC